MKPVNVLLAAAGAAAILAPGAASARASDPPMNQYQSAYYVCSGDQNAFTISYSGAHPRSATMDTSTKKHFALKAAPVSSGAMFAGDGVKFWTDGARVAVSGTPAAYTDCKLH